MLDYDLRLCKHCKILMRIRIWSRITRRLRLLWPNGFPPGWGSIKGGGKIPRPFFNWLTKRYGAATIKGRPLTSNSKKQKSKPPPYLKKKNNFAWFDSISFPMSQRFTLKLRSSSLLTHAVSFDELTIISQSVIIIHILISSEDETREQHFCTMRMIHFIIRESLWIKFRVTLIANANNVFGFD